MNKLLSGPTLTVRNHEATIDVYGQRVTLPVLHLADLVACEEFQRAVSDIEDAMLEAFEFEELD